VSIFFFLQDFILKLYLNHQVYQWFIFNWLWIFYQINVSQFAHAYYAFYIASFLVSYGNVGNNILANIYCYSTVVYLNLLANVVLKDRNISFKDASSNLCMHLLDDRNIHHDGLWSISGICDPSLHKFNVLDVLLFAGSCIIHLCFHVF
jgi:hypothetical protein